ncbi:MAG TPA: CAP domain-containing protein [Burkholderiaceae bacterium]
MRNFRSRRITSPANSAAALLLLLLAACGGAPADAYVPATSSKNTLRDEQPRSTGDAATDSLNWINFRRRQAGLTPLVRNLRLDRAAMGQASYLKTNSVVSHVQTAGKPGFTGATLTDRLAASGYGFANTGHAYGEVIAATGSNSGFNAADELVTAIYHRFVVLEPMSKQAGVAAVNGRSETYFTADTTADGLDQGLGVGRFVTYPASAQTEVPTLFHNDGEKPEPVPGKHDVGFPVSVHADLLSSLQVQRFLLRPQGGAALPVQLLTAALDPNTPTSAAAIIPLEVLQPETTYEVQFVGRVDGVQVARSWQFTTR